MNIDNGLGKFIVVVIAHIIGYGFAVIIHKRELDEWLRPDRWFVNYIRGINVAWKAMFGLTVADHRFAWRIQKLIAELKDKGIG